MRKKFSIKTTINSMFSKFKNNHEPDFLNEDLKSNEMLDEENREFRNDDYDDEKYEVEDNLPEDIEQIGDFLHSKEKRKRRKKNKKKSPLKEISKNKKNARRNGRPKMVVFAASLLLMLVVLFVYCVAYLLSPTYTLVAEITVVRGGYQLNYEICEIPRHILDEDIKVGDEMYFTTHGLPSDTSRNSIKLEIKEITDETVYLDFVAEGFPTFISTKEMKNIIKVTQSGGKQYSIVYIEGKIVANKFSLSQIHT